MRKLLIPVFFLFGCAPAFADNTCCEPPCCLPTLDECDCQFVSHTFFAPQPAFRNGSPERITAFRDRTQARENGHGGALQIVPFGGRSLAPEKLATFFGPSCKRSWRVKEKELIPSVGDILPPDADIRAQLLNIHTANGNFESVIQFCPRQSIFGLGLTLKQEFARAEDANRGFWFGFSAPLVHIKNSVGFYEKVLNDGGGAINTKTVGSMTAALSQNSWNCGKIAGCSLCNTCPTSCCSDGSVNNCYYMTRTRIGDIDVQLGYDWQEAENCKLEAYGGLLIPTGNCAKTTMLFEPIVGNGKHFGISFGGNINKEFLCKMDNEDGSFQIILDLNAYYLFKKTECRLVDLKNKPWSRYMAVFKDKIQATEAMNSNDLYLCTPGVNVFCRGLCVKPGIQCSANISGVYTNNNFQGALGVHSFVRQAECISCASAWKEGPAFKDFVARVTTANEGVTNIAQQINRNNSFQYSTLENYENNIIKESDFDYQSAAHPAMLSCSLYGSLSYRWYEKEYPPFISIGGSYESGRGNAVMNRWLMWAKLGFSY